MSNEELKTILENHKHWLNRDCKDWEHMRADLSNTDLHNADLCGTNLSYANLRGATLCRVDLSNADLRCANLSYADLSYAGLRGANLCEADISNADLYRVDLSNADIREADLHNADLHRANIRYANLCDADLSYADLSRANLCGANIRYANLHDTILYGADFYGANLCGAKNVQYIPYTCPNIGSFIGYKKTKHGIVELEILSDARRCSATGRKCRCDKAKVLGIYDNEHNLLEIKETVSNYDSTFVYKVGEIVEEPNFCEDRWNECSKGIHFFINFQEALNYK